MDDLIEALRIMRKYANPAQPLNCSHDVLWVNVSSEVMSAEDLDRLRELHFEPDNYGGFTSLYFGSC